MRDVERGQEDTASREEQVLGLRIIACRNPTLNMAPDRRSYYDEIVEGNTEKELRDYAEEYFGWHIKTHEKYGTQICDYRTGRLYIGKLTHGGRRKTWTLVNEE